MQRRDKHRSRYLRYFCEMKASGNERSSFSRTRYRNRPKPASRSYAVRALNFQLIWRTRGAAVRRRREMENTPRYSPASADRFISDPQRAPRLTFTSQMRTRESTNFRAAAADNEKC